jgi:hypothetical protein
VLSIHRISFWKGFAVFKALSFSFVLLLVGCAASVTDPARSPDHPANAAAPEAVISAPSQTLAITQMPATAPSGDAMPNMPGMQRMSGGSMHETPTTQAAIYTCVMHPEVISDKPGKCPRCGMTLVLKKGAK